MWQTMPQDFTQKFSKFTHLLKNINPSVAMFSNQTLVVASTVMLNCHPHIVLMCVHDEERELRMQKCHGFVFQIRSFAKKHQHDTNINEQSSCTVAELARCRLENLNIIVNHLVLYCCLHEGEWKYIRT